MSWLSGYPSKNSIVHQRSVTMNATRSMGTHELVDALQDEVRHLRTLLDDVSRTLAHCMSGLVVTYSI